MEQRGISKLNLKRQNRMKILNVLKQQGPISRIDIATILKLTRAAVTIITNEMIEQGVLAEIGEMQYPDGKAPKGRKKMLIDINKNYKFAFGCLIDDKQVSIGISTIAGDVLDKRNMPCDSGIKASRIIDFIVRSYKELLTNNCLKNIDFLGIGIGILPEMYEKMNVIKNENGIADYSSLLKILHMHTELPILISNSVNALALANIDFQKIKSTIPHNFVFLQYGENFNFINVNANEPQKSNIDYTNLADKMIVYPGGEELEGYPRGSVRGELTEIAFIKKVNKFFSKEDTPHLYDLTNGDANQITVDLLKKSVRMGDEKIADLYFKSTRLLAVLIHNLVCSAHPQKVVLHNFFSSEDEFSEFKIILLEASSTFVTDVVEMSIVDNKQSFLGGCALIVREFFYERGGFDRDE